MAALLSHLPTFFSLSSHKPFPLPIPSVLLSTQITVSSAASTTPTISASSIKKPRASRKVKSNVDLCNDIRDFVSAVGLPEGHVPSLKELSQHGRQDLANIVRRRGYKLMKELLATSPKSDRKGSDTEEGISEKQDMNDECEYESTGQDEKVADVDTVVFSSSKVSVEQNNLNSSNGEDTDSDFSSDSNSCLAVESSTDSSLQEKVAKFIQNGELDEIEDDGKGLVELQNVTKESSSLGEENSEQVLHRSGTAMVMNRSISSSKKVVLPPSGNITPRDDYFSSEGPLNADCDGELDVETRKRENQIEVDRLQFMLLQKELELSRLKEQIEKEKLALSLLQTKAETEISKAQKLVSEKDAELHAAEESLSELKEVQIQYWGDGETIEVAGSFNGWHHRIMMDPQPASSILDPIGSRKSRLWTTVLWLYPGTYEIKFVVDGHWRIDPQRESVARGSIQNNILCVDR
ncbi:protein PTST homolog 3, chloroplastic isoform X2 [Actinidia eriantha]|uniref:protein PTST homolog 3, chloroplastic isoform X2 n=1 Tax=Actinidia eriantha TaxID=165200 RepID=UPI0025855943|nr:protein PTST homolog 3, chloroplastic isoform X2 [Actinidia eriantha]